LQLSLLSTTGQHGIPQFSHTHLIKGNDSGNFR
jgi:hypothetical protein